MILEIKKHRRVKVITNMPGGNQLVNCRWSIMKH